MKAIANKKVSTEAVDFHTIRMSREMKIETRKESSSKPAGNDEYEQLVAEDASFNTKPMIEEAAFSHRRTARICARKGVIGLASD
jgi:hypothetical protein